jgi:hypothetical protein
MRSLRVALFVALAVCPGTALPQASPSASYYGRVNSFGILASYSNDSSHILMGIAENRKLLEFGASYSRRLLRNKVVNWQYDGEILPVALESDPVSTSVVTWTSPIAFTSQTTSATVYACQPASGSFSSTLNGSTYSYNYVTSCQRQWTIGEGMSPIGFQWNFLPRHRVQPFLVGHGGYMYSSRPIPVEGAGSFNFTFDAGFGLEIFRSKTRSVRAEYRFHHLSNAYTANENPGIDNGLFQLSYVFGK